MIANVNRSLILALMIILPCVTVILVLFFLIFSIMKAKKNGERTTLKMILFTIISILLAAVSWIFNMGWIRFIFTLILLPFIHAIIFFVTNLFVSKYITKSGRLKLLNIIFFVTYLMGYVLLPDGADVGGLYVFFGLIHNDVIATACEAVCVFAVITHIVVFILQIIQMIKSEQEMKSQSNIE